MSEAIAEAFHANLREQPTNLTQDDLPLRYPAPTSATSRGSEPLLVPTLEQVRYYSSDFAASPSELNAKYDAAREQAKRKHGERYLCEIITSNTHHELKRQRCHDFRFTDVEKQRLQQHGFMVSERLGAESFAEVYYRLYTDDMPVYVTSDSVLHAWHRSFDAFLMELEMQELMPLLNKILVKALGEVTTAYDAASSEATTDDLRSVLADVELYLTAAHRLLLGESTQQAQASVPDENPALTTLLRICSGFDVSETDVVGEPVSIRVTSNANRLLVLLGLVSREELTKTAIFGSPRNIDFSLFKPRGHYTKTVNLQSFFRAMTWLGTIDFRIDGSSDSDENAKANERHQLQCACVLVHVLDHAGVMPLVKTLHETISAIAGDGVGVDGMTPMQLHELLVEGDEGDIVTRFFGPGSDARLIALQDKIANRGLGTQAISGYPMKVNPGSKQPTRPPTAFAFVGQQFVWSAFVFSKLVFDQVIDGETGQKVPRRMVSAVDAAFALFGNNVAGIEIAMRMKGSKDSYDDELVEFRDGLPYAPSLIAAREVVDEAMEKASADPGSCSLALLWQLALRELSRPSAHGDQVFQSETWQKRQMNTQIASFTQLRHDTILYARQGITVVNQCEYPAGFVDPYPAFSAKMQDLANRAVAIVSAMKLANAREGAEPKVQRIARACFENFAAVCGKLGGIARAQASSHALTEEQLSFLKNVIEEQSGSGIYRYLGWYPSLFYTSREDSGKQEHLVADVHTDAPCLEHDDPGGVLHLGVGDVNLGVFVVDDVMYAGPVFSHYEFVTPINERMTDDEFSGRLSEFKAPQWATRSFLVANKSEPGIQPVVPEPRSEGALGRIARLLGLSSKTVITKTS